MNVDDDALMKRFLVGDVTAEERTAVETRFIQDAAYAEALCALEEELLLLYVRRALPEEWHARVEASIAVSAARQRQVASMRRFVASLERARASETAARQSSRLKILAFAAAIAALIAAVPAIVRWVDRDVDRHIGAPVAPERATAPVDVDAAARAARGAGENTGGTVFAVVLRPGLLRSKQAAAQNLIRVPAGTQAIGLRFTESIPPLAAMQAVIRPVGEAPLRIEHAAEIRGLNGEIAVEWVIPARQLPPGDYLVTVTGETRARHRESLATRFFTIVE